MTRETHIRDQIVAAVACLFECGYTHGSTSNISMPVENGLIVTPAGSSFGTLDPARLSKLGFEGNHLSGGKPAK